MGPPGVLHNMIEVYSEQIYYRYKRYLYIDTIMESSADVGMREGASKR